MYRAGPGRSSPAALLLAVTEIPVVTAQASPSTRD